MSVNLANIRMLRALAYALSDEAVDMEKNSRTVSPVIRRLSAASMAAADDLEKQDRDACGEASIKR